MIPAVVVIHPGARRAYHGLPLALPAGSWVVTEAGELQVRGDGSITPRPTPIPWSRLSIAADPCVGSRKVA